MSLDTSVSGLSADAIPGADTGSAQSPGAERIASHLHATPSWNPDDFAIPEGREEIWRFTPLRRLRGLLDAPATGSGLTESVDLPAQVSHSEITPQQARELAGRAPMDRLAVLAADRAATVSHLQVPAEAQVDEPVIIRLHGGGAQDIVHSHRVITVGPYAKATIVLEHTGSATYSAFTTVTVGEGAQVNLIELQLWDDDAVHVGQTSTLVGRDATVNAVTATFGGDLVRLNQTTDYATTGGELNQYGLYFADAGQHLEHRLLVDHSTPKSTSHVDYRGALQGEGAHTVWIGDVLIRKAAEGIDTYESNRNLLLTEGCRADAVPNLEIETGEIAGAGHAATSGRFDDEQLFYLTSRGIPEDQARKLVVFGFFTEIIRRIGVPSIEEALNEMIHEELDTHFGTGA